LLTMKECIHSNGSAQAAVEKWVFKLK